ncbi:MAG: hypothetical protein WCQ16_11415 [Verrucomicrobiae bacterium]
MRRPARHFLFVLCLAVISCGRQPEQAAGETAPVARRLAAQLDADLRRVREEAGRLAATVAKLYENKEEILPRTDRSKYEFSKSGAFHKPVNDGTGGLWISGAVPITEDVREAAYLTDPLDKDLIRIVREFPEVNQSYYNDRNSMNRIYPWFDAISQYPPKMNIPDFNFYYLADEKHNPSRGAVWVDEPYVDPAGRGWVVSAIAPVYQGEQLLGVAGLNVAIDTIVDRYFKDSGIPLVVLARNGVVVAGTENAIELLGLPPLKDHKYLETVKQDTFKPDEYNVAKSQMPGLRDMAAAILEQGAGSVAVRFPGRTYKAVAVPVPEAGWKVVEFVAP